MSEQLAIPFIPVSAPFSSEQRSWLNGFLAGVFSHAPQAVSQVKPTAGPTVEATPLTIYFGSQTGNSEGLARRLSKSAKSRGFAATVADLADCTPTSLQDEKNVLIVTSTFGDGEPPDSAKEFWDALCGASASGLGELRYSVLALGDSNYEKFCTFGIELDRRLEALGALRIHPRVDCDVNFDEPSEAWFEGVIGALRSGEPNSELRHGGLRHGHSTADATSSATSSGAVVKPVAALAHSRRNPFSATLLENKPLSGIEAASQARHVAFSIAGSAMTYEIGDAIGVRPTNCSQRVAEILDAVGYSGDEPVEGLSGETKRIGDALMTDYDIRQIAKPMLEALAKPSPSALLRELTQPSANGTVKRYLDAHDLIDLIQEAGEVRIKPSDFVRLLRPLQPRLYSVASSPKVVGGEIHATVRVVRHMHRGRMREGVCSTFLADRLDVGRTAPVFVHRNKNFRLPAEGSLPILMVGVGVGVGSLRAFLQERRAVGSRGENWLIFGERDAATDFLYGDDLKAMKVDGHLARFDAVFSGDASEGECVRRRMLACRREIYQHLEDGGHFYLCGEATRIDGRVDMALREIVMREAAVTADAAQEYIKQLKAEKRYQRDVY